MWKDGHFVSARNSCTHKVDEKVCCQNSQIVFIRHSLTDAVKCECSNASLQFVLVKQMHNAQLHNCQKKCMTAFEQTRLPFWTGSSTEIIAVWFLSHTYKPRSHHILLHSQWILNSFQVFPACPGMWWHSPPTAPHLASRKQDFAAIQYMFRLFQNDVNWPKWNSQHVRNITDSDSSLFVNEFLHSIHFFIRCAHWWDILSILHLHH